MTLYCEQYVELNSYRGSDKSITLACFPLNERCFVQSENSSLTYSVHFYLCCQHLYLEGAFGQLLCSDAWRWLQLASEQPLTGGCVYE